MTASDDAPSKAALAPDIDRRNARAVDLCLVMCSRQKGPAPAMAEQMYVSERFSNDRNAAASAGCDWMIVSGHYGLLEPQQMITPYDLNLDDTTFPRKVAWTFRLVIQLLLRVGFLGPYRIAISARGTYHQGLVWALRLLRFRLPPTHNPGLPAQFEEWRRE